LAVSAGKRFWFRQFPNVVKIPVGGKALKCPDSYRVIEFPAAAPPLAWVMTYAAADSREGITIPDGIDCFQILTGCNVGHIFGNIYAHRTGMLAR
jgi:hypothetical protein